MKQGDEAIPASDRWPTFTDVLAGLHRDRIWISAEQLATFFVFHGLPVDLIFVPPELRARAAQINQHYQGDLARLDRLSEDISVAMQALSVNASKPFPANRIPVTR